MGGRVRGDGVTPPSSAAAPETQVAPAPADHSGVPMSGFRILSHRALLDGPAPALENTLESLAAACAAGFDVEFDVHAAPRDGRLVLSHDPADWCPQREPAAFLAAAAPGAGHALNVKSLARLDALLDLVDRMGAREGCFLFDFELLGAPEPLLHEVQERGFRVAFRVSDREPTLERHARDARVRTIWLDELDGPWVRREHVQRLAAAGKQVFYVSPDLHGRRDRDVLLARWAQLHEWGAAGICTDFPLMLRDFLGGTS